MGWFWSTARDLARDVIQTLKETLFTIKNLDVILCILRYLLSGRSISLIIRVFFSSKDHEVRKVSSIRSERGGSVYWHILFWQELEFSGDPSSCLDFFNSRCLFRCSVAGLFQGRNMQHHSPDGLACLQVEGSRFILKYGQLFPAVMAGIQLEFASINQELVEETWIFRTAQIQGYERNSQKLA